MVQMEKKLREGFEVGKTFAKKYKNELLIGAGVLATIGSVIWLKGQSAKEVLDVIEDSKETGEELRTYTHMSIVTGDSPFALREFKSIDPDGTGWKALMCETPDGNLERELTDMALDIMNGDYIETT